MPNSERFKGPSPEDLKIIHLDKSDEILETEAEENLDIALPEEPDRDDRLSKARQRVQRASSRSLESSYSPLDSDKDHADVGRLESLLGDTRVSLLDLKSLLERRVSLKWYNLLAKRDMDNAIEDAKFQISSRLEAVNDFDLPYDLRKQVDELQKSLNYITSDKTSPAPVLNKKLVLAVGVVSQLLLTCGTYEEKRPDTKDTSTIVTEDVSEEAVPTDSFTPVSNVEMPGDATMAVQQDLPEADTEIQNNKNENSIYPDKVNSFKNWRRSVLEKAGLIEHEKSDGTVPTTKKGFEIQPGTIVKLVDNNLGQEAVVASLEVKKGQNVWAILEQMREDVEQRGKMNGWETVGIIIEQPASATTDTTVEPSQSDSKEESVKETVNKKKAKKRVESPENKKQEKYLEINKNINKIQRALSEIILLKGKVASFQAGDSRRALIEKKIAVLEKQAFDDAAKMKKDKEVVFDQIQETINPELDGDQGEEKVLEQFKADLENVSLELGTLSVKIFDNSATAEENKRYDELKKQEQTLKSRVENLNRYKESLRATRSLLNSAMEDKMPAEAPGKPWKEIEESLQKSAGGVLVGLVREREAFLPEAPGALESGVTRADAEVNILINNKDNGIVSLLEMYSKAISENKKDEAASFLDEARTKLDKAYEWSSIHDLDGKLQVKIKKLEAIISSFEGDNKALEELNTQPKQKAEVAFPSGPDKKVSYTQYGQRISKLEKRIRQSKDSLVKLEAKTVKTKADLGKMDALRAQLDSDYLAKEEAQRQKGLISEQARIHVRLKGSQIQFKDITRNKDSYSKADFKRKLEEVRDSLMDVATDWRAQNQDDKEARNLLEKVETMLEEIGK